MHTVLGPGALFGEESMFGGIERIVSVRSSMQTTLLAVKGTDLDGLLQGYPEIVEQIRVRSLGVSPSLHRTSPPTLSAALSSQTTGARLFSCGGSGHATDTRCRCHRRSAVCV